MLLGGGGTLEAHKAVSGLLLLLHFESSVTLAGVDGVGSPTVTIPRIEAAALIDGSLDEPAWEQAVNLTGVSQYQPSDGRPAEEQTEVLVWYAPDALYFGIVASDADPGSIRATVANRDNLDRDDTITIFLDTFNDHRRAFFFAVNPLGAQQDGVQSEGAGADRSPDYTFESKGRLTPDGYVVELRIPFKSLRYPGRGPQTWGINIMRKVQRTGYQDTWTDVRRGSATFLAQSGAIDGLHDLERGLVTELQPFVTTTEAGSRQDDGTFSRGALQMNPGLNARIGLTNLSFNGTIKPDFSQVESDVGLVTVNERFALFFPERRPFFLEGLELFATPNQLVYTRQIGTPIVGGKVTGKVGAFGIAYLNALDDTDTGHVAFNITRVRRDFGTNSLAGVTYTDRTGAGAFNRVLAGDARVVFAKLYYVQGQIGRAWTKEGGLHTSSPVWQGIFDRTGRSWGFNYSVNGIGESFVTRAGFVPRTNIVEARVNHRVTFYGEPGATMENATVRSSSDRVWQYEAVGRHPPIEGSDTISLNLNVRGGWFATASVFRSFVRFDPQAYVAYAIQTPASGQAPWNCKISARRTRHVPVKATISGCCSHHRDNAEVHSRARLNAYTCWQASMTLQ